MLKVSFKTIDDAFLDERDLEVARILREIADKIESGLCTSRVFDHNDISSRWRVNWPLLQTANVAA